VWGGQHDNISLGLNGTQSLEVKDVGITAAKMATNSVTSDAIANANVTGAKIANNTITAANMNTGSVTSDAILNGTIAAVNFGTKVVTSGAIADNTITAANLQTGSVTSDAILNGTIIGGDLATNINISTTGYITSETLLVRAPNYISNVALGTQPYSCTSTTENTNLNAGMVNGRQIIAGSTTFNGVANTGPFTIAATGCTTSSIVQAAFSVNPSVNRAISQVVPGTNQFTIYTTGNLTAGTNNYTCAWIIAK
jgi:hypothetical protein